MESANLEGIDISFPQAQVIYDGGIINGLKVNDVITVNNLKHAWDFLFESENIDYDYYFVTHLHKLTVDKLLTENYVGKLRTIPVSISGTEWKPDFPIESKIKEELELILNQDLKSKTEIAIDAMLFIMRKQMFIDGNKRVAMLFGNKIMIDNGCGIITIAQKDIETFYEKLIKFYETGKDNDLKKFIYNNCIDGLDL